MSPSRRLGPHGGCQPKSWPRHGHPGCCWVLPAVSGLPCGCVLGLILLQQLDSISGSKKWKIILCVVL